MITEIFIKPIILLAAYMLYTFLIAWVGAYMFYKDLSKKQKVNNNESKE